MRASGGQSVTFAWDPSNDISVTGYKIYYGTLSGIYTNSIDLGASTIATIPGLVEGTTYYFVVTAYNAGGLESTPSNEVAYDAPIIFTIPGPTLQLTPAVLPGHSMRVSFLASPNQVYELQTTEDFRTWTTIWYSLPFTVGGLVDYFDAEPSESEMRFYRVVAHSSF